MPTWKLVFSGLACFAGSFAVAHVGEVLLLWLLRADRDSRTQQNPGTVEGIRAPAKARVLPFPPKLHERRRAQDSSDPTVDAKRAATGAEANARASN
jgi:hypothetical protein